MTQHTLITFLGRTPKGENGYCTTRYVFDDGSQSAPVAFLGWALQKRLNPDKLVILGTSGSMWDHLFEEDYQFGAEMEAERLALIDAVQNKSVEQARLDELETALANKLGCAVRLQLIPYCRNEAEQIELLRIIADNVKTGDSVELDITHGLRHQPMLALLSALHIQGLRSATVQHIWYGAFEQGSEQTSVHDLAGLLKIADWLKALAIYDHSGDYSGVADLVGGNIGTHLKNTAFLETVNRIGQARSQGRKVLSQLNDTSTVLDPTAELFSEELQRRLAWVDGNMFHDRQRQLCFEYLEHGRFFEAVVTGWEAFTSKLVQQAECDPGDFKNREGALEHFRNNRQDPRWQSYDKLRRLRNAMVHGSQPVGREIQSAMTAACHMEALLVPLLNELLLDRSSNESTERQL